jgi:hypothetical protein
LKYLALAWFGVGFAFAMVGQLSDALAKCLPNPTIKVGNIFAVLK